MGVAQLVPPLLLEALNCFQACTIGGSTPKPGPFLLCEKKGGKKSHQGAPLDPFRGAGGKGPLPFSGTPPLFQRLQVCLWQTCENYSKGTSYRKFALRTCGPTLWGWRLPTLKKRIYFHGPQASCMAMESGTLFFVRPSPPQGEVGLPAVPTYKHWPLTIRARRLGNAKRRRGC